jgi:molecular chaperone GrpE
MAPFDADAPAGAGAGGSSAPRKPAAARHKPHASADRTTQAQRAEAPDDAGIHDADAVDADVVDAELIDAEVPRSDVLEGDVVEGDVVEGEVVDEAPPGAAGKPTAGKPAAGTAGAAGKSTWDIGEPAGEALGADSDLWDAAAAAGIPELTAVERLTIERDEYLDALRRLQADFENFRKRVRRQEEELWTRAVESLVERLLPVIDAASLALEHSGDEKDATAIAQVASLLWDTLAKEGLERVDRVGVPFEPTVHDAVAHEGAGESDAGTGPVVSAVLRPGYLLRGKVLRPAMVTVKG